MSRDFSSPRAYLRRGFIILCDTRCDTDVGQNKTCAVIKWSSIWVVFDSFYENSKNGSF